MKNDNGWDDAPSWAVCRATDYDGMRRWFEYRPVPFMHLLVWGSGTDENDKLRTALCDHVSPPGYGFTDKLEVRP